MNFTTEMLIEHPGVFNVPTITNVQRGWCRALDGLPLGDLADDPNVLQSFGGVIPEPGTPPKEAHLVLAIRTLKTVTAAAKCIVWSQTVDVTPCSRGDICRISVVSLTIAATRQVMSHLLAAVQQPLLKPLVVGDASVNGIVLRHPSGRSIEIVPVALDRAGGSATSVFSAGAIFDEEPRAIGAEDGVKNWDHFHQTIVGRILDGGQFLGVGSPWVPSGPVFDIVKERFGKPGRDVLIVRAPGPLANPIWWTRERIESLRGTPSFAPDVLGEFCDPLLGLLTASAVRRNVRPSPPVMARPKDRNVVIRAGIDPSEGRQGGNAFALTVMAGYVRQLEDGSAATHFDVLCCQEWRGESLPMIFRRIAGIVGQYGTDEIWSDQWSKQALRDLAAREGLTLRFLQKSAQDRMRDWDTFVTAIDDDAITLPPDDQLVNDLLGARRRITPAGFTVELPTGADGRHADKAASLQLCFSTYRNTKLNIEGRKSRLVVLSDLAAAGFEGAPTPQQRAMAEQIEARAASGFSPEQMAAAGLQQRRPERRPVLTWTTDGRLVAPPTNPRSAY